VTTPVRVPKIACDHSVAANSSADANANTNLPVCFNIEAPWFERSIPPEVENCAELPLL
jgi:hypothetical protein